MRQVALAYETGLVLILRGLGLAVVQGLRGATPVMFGGYHGRLQRRFFSKHIGLDRRNRIRFWRLRCRWRVYLLHKRFSR